MITDNCIVAAVIVAVLGVGSLFINSVATSDSDNVAGSKHPGPVPAGVTQFSADSYLIADDAKVSENDLCRGTNSGGDRFEDTRTMGDGSIYVECGDDQQWNFTPVDDTNFGEAIISTLDEPGWFLPVGGALLLIALVPLSVATAGGIGSGVRKLRTRRTRYDMLEQRRRELVKSWANDDIDDLTYERKFRELVEQGVKRA